jgi:hypothetical protein
MEMHHIWYFLAVADELNFTKAAEKYNVSQPSLTRAIKLLEEELGGLLFHRERAHTRLSDLGQMMRPYLQQIHTRHSFNVPSRSWCRRFRAWEVRGSSPSAPSACGSRRGRSDSRDQAHRGRAAGAAAQRNPPPQVSLPQTQHG